MFERIGNSLASLIEAAGPDGGETKQPAAPGKTTRVPPPSPLAVPPSAVERVKAYADEIVVVDGHRYTVTADGGFAGSAGAGVITRANDAALYARLVGVLLQRAPAKLRPGAPMSVAPASAAPPAACTPPAPPAAPPREEHATVTAVNAAFASRQHAAPAGGARDASVEARPFPVRAMSEAITRDRQPAVSAGELRDAEHRLIAAFETKAYGIALTQLDANERIALAEAGRYGETSSGDPSTEANRLRAAAGALAPVQQLILGHIDGVNASQPDGAPQAHVTVDNLDDYLDAPILQGDPAYRALRLRYDTLRQVYGPAFPILLHRNTDFTAIANADPARLAQLIAGTAGDVLAKIRKTRAKLTPDKIWSLSPVVELTRRAMGLDTSCYAQHVIDQYKAGCDREEAFIQIALGAFGLVLALAGIAVTVGSAGAAAPVGAAAVATAEAMSSIALATAGLGVYTAIAQYAEYDFQHAAAGASLDPVTALTAEDPSLGWLVLAIVGACVDIGAAVIAFRNLAAIARAVKTVEALTALEEAARAQAGVLRQQGKLSGSEQEFVNRVMRSAEAKLADKTGKARLASALEDEVAAAEKAYAAANKPPVAILPSGREIPPHNFGGGFHCPREQTPPDIAFKDGLEARGSDLRLKQHAMPHSESPDPIGDGSAFRGTTPEPTAANDAAEATQGAVYWGEVGDWVYEIRGVPTWSVEKALEGQIRLPDGTFAGKLHTVAELEGAIPARVPPQNIVRAGKIAMLPSGRKFVPEWIPNPSYKPRTP